MEILAGYGEASMARNIEIKARIASASALYDNDTVGGTFPRKRLLSTDWCCVSSNHSFIVHVETSG
jgi:hypothetical protein